MAAPWSMARIGSTRPVDMVMSREPAASCWMTPALACPYTRSMSTFSALKKPLSRPMKTGQRLAEGDPTVPTVTLSAAQAAPAHIGVASTSPSAARASIIVIRISSPLHHAAHSSRPLRCPPSISYLCDVRQKESIGCEIRGDIAQLLQGLDHLAELSSRYRSG